MRREIGIPIFLWICAAAWIHTLAGGGGWVAADLHDGNSYVTGFGDAVRERVRLGESTTTIDIGDGEPAPAPEQPTAEHEKVPQPKPEAKALPIPSAKPEPEKPKPPAIVPPKATPPKPELKLLAKVEEKKEPPPAPASMPKDQRIAVKQHVVPEQDDNATAKFIADEANRVAEEKVATQTSHDQDDPHPTPGSSAAGPKGEVGNSEKTRIADSDNHEGEKNRAPGERGTQFNLEPFKPAAVAPQPSPKADPSAKAGGDGKVASSGTQAPVTKADPAPESKTVDVQNTDQGAWTFHAVKPDAQPINMAQAFGSVASPSSKPPSPFMGLGGSPGPGKTNLNLSHEGMIASVGTEQLQKERVADGERRLTQHRGSWQSASLERWKSAIENYVSSVKPGNQTALNTARVPFATFLSAMHVRIHPIFADTFLDTLSNLPPENPLSNRKMFTRLEIVLTKDGQVDHMGIVKTSGITMFDVAALDSVQRASPFGPAPAAIISRDGKVYLHWEFHRDEVYACSTMNARPFMLTTPAADPAAEPPAPGKPPVRDPQEGGGPGAIPQLRHGQL